MTDSPAAWHPDPMGRHQLRYWDGKAWTDHVSDNGVQGTDPLQPRGLDKVDSALTIGNEGDAAKIQQQLHGESRTAARKSARPRSSAAARSSPSRSWW